MKKAFGITCLKGLVLLMGQVMLFFTLPSCTSIEVPEGTVPPEQVPRGNAFVFDDTALPSLTIKVPLEEWNALLKAYDNDSMTREYVHCDVVMVKDNRRYPVSDAGLRLRGQTSRRRPEGSNGVMHKAGDTKWRHCHFGLNFRHFHKGDKDYDLRGVHRIILKYAHEDATYIREKYCSDLLKRFGIWTAGEVSFCRLYIKVEGDEDPAYYGVYQMIEAVDDEYMENRPQFGSDSGYLWKLGQGANLADKDSWRFGVDENKRSEPPYELKTGKDEFGLAKAQILDFITNLNKLQGDEFVSWISSHCDVDLLLKTYAAFVALGHWDDYWNNMNNTYIYFNSRDRYNYVFYMIPYDMDNTLGTSHVCGVQTNSGTHSPYRWGQDQCTLMPKILAVKEFRTRYTSYLKTMVAPGSPFLFEPSVERIHAWHALISPYLENDTRENMAIYDVPASWSNHREYRVWTDGAKNWFRVKTQVLSDL